MENKPFALGIMVGRFQSLHSGHEMMIRRCIELCENTGIFVGSSQESGTAKNPFSYEEREMFLKKVFGDEIKVYPLPDIGVGNVPLWGEYVLKNVKEHFGRFPDLLVSGKESRRVEWFDTVEGASISELYIPKTIEISATEIRKCIIGNDINKWRSFVNPLLWEYYPLMREKILASKDNLVTKSV